MFKFANVISKFKVYSLQSMALSLLVALMAETAGAVALAPQDIVDLALKQAPAVKKAELNAQASEGAAEKSRGAYDLIWRLAPTYTYSEAQNLSGFANPVDKTFNLVTSLGKSFSTGTNVTLQYNRTSQESELSTFTSALRRPTAAEDVLKISIRQALWRNILGEADRASLQSADAAVTIARLSREEALETAILDSLSIFWNAYVAEVQLKENTSARTKYEELVKAVRRKAGFNLSSPGELPRLEAEFEAVDTRVKISSKEYLSALDTLRTNLQIDTKEPITFKASAVEKKDIPEIPKLKMVEFEALRPLVISRLSKEIAERSKTVLMQSARPRLDLVASAATTGVDQSSETAFSKMTSATDPTYVIGIELEVPLDSSAFRGIEAEESAKYKVAEIDFRIASDRLRNDLLNYERTAQAFRDSALSSIEIVAKRERVVREFEASYRQGRTPLVELIRAFNELFDAQLNRARSVGNYMIALNQWAAIRDELVKGETR